MDIRDKVQIDAIKDREEYSICEYGTHVLIYNGTYGVYVPEEILLLNPKRYENRKETYVRSRRCAYGRRREKDSRGNGCRRKCNRDH